MELTLSSILNHRSTINGIWIPYYLLIQLYQHNSVGFIFYYVITLNISSKINSSTSARRFELLTRIMVMIEHLSKLE